MYRLAFLLSIFSAAAFGAFVTCASAAASLEGSWSGSGVITHGGGSDQVHCRVRYTKAGGSAYTYTSTCATDTGRYDLSGRIRSSGGNRYTGTVSSPNYKGTGKVLLFQKGNSLSITVTSGKGSARMTLGRR